MNVENPGSNIKLVGGEPPGIITPVRSGVPQAASAAGGILDIGLQLLSIGSESSCGENTGKSGRVVVQLPSALASLLSSLAKSGQIETLVFDGVGELSTALDDRRLEPGVWVLVRLLYQPLPLRGMLVSVVDHLPQESPERGKYE